MDKYLIDTHIFLWSLNDPSQLSGTVLEVLKDQVNTIYVSAAATWEIMIKRSKGALKFKGDVLKQLYEQSFLPLSITHQHAALLENMPQIHNDPFDRIMIAQALIEDLTFITHDKEILRYPNVKFLKA